MTNITKKQATLAVIAVVFATAMIASVIATSDSVFAHKSNHKSIKVTNEQNQRSLCVTGGGHSSINSNACRNTSTSTTSNDGGNVL